VIDDVFINNFSLENRIVKKSIQRFGTFRLEFKNLNLALDLYGPVMAFYSTRKVDRETDYFRSITDMFSVVAAFACISSTVISLNPFFFAMAIYRES